MATNDLTFNVGENKPAKTEALAAFLNVGTKDKPDWAILGIRVTSSSAEMDWQKEEFTDITGKVYASIKTPIINQTFDGWTINGGDRAQQHIWNLGVRNQDTASLQAQDVLRVHFYAGTSTAPFAERFDASTVLISSLGGDSGGNLNMPISVTCGGTRSVGTATSADGVVTFTPDSTGL
jgi:hypothetical protein